MTIKLGIIGTSPGNGHPYSWSAICNGYDPAAMVNCGFSVIPQYLGQRTWPEDQLPGVQVTHVWTQDLAESRKIAEAARIKTIVVRPEDMMDEIDALLLARDDAENHLRLAEPFLRAGLPVYIDKPIALSEADFNALLSLQRRPGQIFSCSALRFAEELQLDAVTHQRVGPIRLVQAMTPKYWQTYAVHLIDPVLRMLGHEAEVQKLFSGPVGKDGRLLALRWPDGGPDVHLMTTGSSIPSPLTFRVVGEGGEVTLAFQDSFSAFRTALAEFLAGVEEGSSRLSQAFNRRAVQIIEMGL
ncbi:Gfo/Idh/MocA family oxidoreductase [Pseudogemmobacter faecipullorum]|uniref:Gfo/Idh/MocA family oxidoreductase n=1 Tax=Pseudogemmobacter faecipullorum TaxID=2755041 RepID=A0ABS8CRH9_9RHOB|nr:Gfo/Idh/MocA family oxidoreductase [Pseudogemmobacter faecipullorum]MCB5411974.1 Gfo/Idh/MocA family oxidoreductase [Pseudogemmobacter faecipullorum]